MRAMTKAELAKRAGVSHDTFERWLDEPLIRQQLEALNVKKYQRILPPRAVQIIADHYVIEID